MGDFYSGTIRIPTNYIDDDVIDALRNEGLITIVVDEEEIYGDEKNGISSYTMDEARNGEFFELQVDLERWGIPYDIQSQGYHDSMPQTRYFRPDIEDSTHDTVYMNSDGMPVIPADKILELYGQICLEEVSREDVRLRLKEHLENYAGLKYPPLQSYVKTKGE